MKIVRYLFSNLETSLLTIFLVLFSFGQLQRVQLNGDIAFYLHDLVIALFVGWRVIGNKKTLITLKNLINNNHLELVWIGWILVSMVMGSLAGKLTATSWLYLIRIIGYIVFVWQINKSKAIAYSPRNGFLITGLLIGLWGLIQYIFIPDTRFLYLFGWDNHYYRLISTLFDPAFTGAILVMTWGFMQDKLSFKLPDWMKKISLLLLIVALVATFSRATYLSWSILLITLTFIKKLSLKKLLISILIFTATLLLLPKPGGEGVNLARMSTVEARYQNSQQNLIKLSGLDWLWGRGLFNTDTQQDYRTPNHAQLPDSLPILILNATGVGGALLSLLLFKKWFANWLEKDRLWASIFLVMIIHSLFNNTLLQPFVFLMLWGSKKS